MALGSRRFSQDERLQAAARNKPPLKKGATGRAVALLQTALLDLGFLMPITTAHGTKQPDGIYGDESVAVVRDFQTQQSLSADGIAGQDTIGRLDAILRSQEDAQLQADQSRLARLFWT